MPLSRLRLCIASYSHPIRARITKWISVWDIFDTKIKLLGDAFLVKFWKVACGLEKVPINSNAPTMPRRHGRIPLSTKEERPDRTSALVGNSEPRMPSNGSKQGTTIRRKHNKTRTGCLTCRSVHIITQLIKKALLTRVGIRGRRVKCDETRPACERCVKFGWDCEGYRTDSETPGLLISAKRQGRKLVPKSNLLPELGPMKMFPRGMFTDDWQSHYFQYYVNEVATQIRGPNETSLWERLVPQAGEAETFIVHAIAALGALSKSQILVSDPDAPPNPMAVNWHRQYALVQYGKALHGMRLAIQNQAQDRGIGLVACLLVFCLECLLGHQAAAAAYAASGVSLFFSSEAEKTTPSSIAEDELYSAFSNLDMQSSSYVHKSADHHQQLKEDTNKALGFMPDVFTGLKECKAFLQLIMRPNMHLLVGERKEWLAPAPSTPTELEPNALSWTAMKMEQYEDTMQELLDEREQCFVNIRRWEAASTSILSRTDVTIEDRIVSAVMKVNAALNVVIVARKYAQVYPPELIYDEYLSEFRTIVNHCSTVRDLLLQCDYKFQSAKFRFDIGVIPALVVTGTWCYDRDIRAWAINSLLECDGYREGIWDAISQGTICNSKRSFEEEFIDATGFVPGNRRSTMIRQAVDLQERTADVAFKQRMGDGPEDFVIREAILRW